MNSANLDDLLNLGMSQAGYPPATPAPPPAGKTPEHLQENDSSSISEFKAQVKEAARDAFRGLLKTPEDIAAVKFCIRWHSTNTDCVSPIEPSDTLAKAEKAVADILERKTDIYTPLPRADRRLLKRYKSEAFQAEVDVMAPFVGQWQECKRCNP